MPNTPSAEEFSASDMQRIMEAYNAAHESLASRGIHIEKADLLAWMVARARANRTNLDTLQPDAVRHFFPRS